jgi:hypothetical protein
MTCDVCGEWFTGTRCSCGWQAPSLQVVNQQSERLWAITECSHLGCTVVIRALPGQVTGLCKWHQQGKAYNNASGPTAMRPESHLPAMTKDEFGLELYEAIRINGARLACEAKGKLPEAKALEDQLQAILPKLKNPADVRRILEMH